MEVMTVRELVGAVGGRLLQAEAAGQKVPEERLFCGVVTDNRKVCGGELFCAIVGERLDGNDFAQSALEAGAAGCLISREPDLLMPDKFYVLVEDTTAALGALAAYYLRKFDIPVVAVTGSVGKTTAKQMLASVLSQHYSVLYTEGNLNNHIGLPMTIFRLERTHEIAVLEMGMNHFGEIDYLARIAPPDTAVITNVGDAHIQNLGSRENIFRSKCEIFRGMKDGGTAVINGDDPLLRTLCGASEVPDDLAGDPLYDEVARKKIRFLMAGEAPDCTLRACSVHCGEEETVVSACGSHSAVYTVPALGRHMLYPALLAAAVGALYGLTTEEIAEGIRCFKQTGMRMKIERKGGLTILNDAYNANPQSMQAALRILAGQSADRKVAVLGDMLELGEFSEKLHREIGAFCAQQGISALITVGENAAFIADEARRSGLAEVYAFADKEQASARLKAMCVPGTAILFKASRGMALEEMVKMIEE
ncbi:MAG: UDP-N-acetylmuramoyl-tripeptide--D-alanyl-D-alanine ligase [Lachnospiraceae bacterium]|nr:UDP-N-acetylmuramoyl-tripeptide--D-alanyl-D-alanine ligase [Lachnospiraceae bacterium]